MNQNSANMPENQDQTEVISMQNPFKKGLYMTVIGLMASAIAALWVSLSVTHKSLNECQIGHASEIERLKNEQLAQMKEQEQRLDEIEEKYRQILFNVREAQREVRKKTNSQ